MLLPIYIYCIWLVCYHIISLLNLYLLFICEACHVPLESFHCKEVACITKCSFIQSFNRGEQWITCLKLFVDFRAVQTEDWTCTHRHDNSRVSSGSDICTAHFSAEFCPHWQRKTDVLTINGTECLKWELADVHQKKYNLSLHKTIETYGLCVIMRSFFFTHQHLKCLVTNATIIYVC